MGTLSGFSIAVPIRSLDPSLFSQLITRYLALLSKI